MSCADQGELTDDAFLGGRVRILQPKRGHRSGLEAVMIAAACPARPGETVLDMGAGAGVAAICLLSRIPDARAVLVEADAATADLARENLQRNGLADRAEVHCLEIGGKAAALNAVADHAVSNPPFRDPARHRSSPERSAAHLLSVEDVEAWIRFAAGAIRGSGTLTLVHEAEALRGLLAAWNGRFGGPAVLPLHPRPGTAARRVLLQGARGGRRPLSLLPSLFLHHETGHGFTDRVEAVLRCGDALALAGDTRDRGERSKD